MNLLTDLGLFAGGGVVAFAAQSFVAWLKSRGDMHRVDRDADIRLDAQRDNLALALLESAREDMSGLRAELAELRPLQTRVAHLEEALDHVHALLHADGPDELRAAQRRARAFLKRMRPEIGDLRNIVQAADSAQELKRRMGAQ